MDQMEQEYRLIEAVEKDRKRTKEHVEKLTSRMKSLFQLFYQKQMQGYKFEQPLIQIYEKEDAKTALHWFQINYVSSVKFISKKPLKLEFKANNKKDISCDFICASYGTPTQIRYDNQGFRRYIYFEVCYETLLATCLMPFHEFKKRKSFPEFEMDTYEWNIAKQQMEIWSDEIQSLQVKINIRKEIPPFTRALYDRLNKASKTPLQPNVQFYPCDDNIIWPLVSYIESIHLSPVLPSKFFPSYALCYICTEKELPSFQIKLKKYLSKLYSSDTIIAGRIALLNKHLKDDGSDIGSGWPYLLPVGKGTSATATAVLTAINRYAQTPYKDEINHPFRNHIPILLSTQAIPSSTVLNIPVSKKDLDVEWPSIESINTNIQILHLHYFNMYFSTDPKPSLAILTKNITEIYNLSRRMDTAFEGLSNLATFFSWLYFGPDSEDGEEWLREQSTKWTASPTTPDESMAAVLKYLKANLPDPDFFPSNLDDFKEEHPIFTKGQVNKESGTTETLIYWNKKDFEKNVGSLCPHVTAQDILPLLLKDGYLLVGKDASHKYQSAVNIHGKTTWGYCFYKSKVDGATEGSS